MSNRSICQLLIHPPAGGAWNMAVDEALLCSVPALGVPCLRFYQWQRPTLSLGYFQNYSDRESHPHSAEVEVVRRLSGGGAILHDRELTYSLVLPKCHPLAQDTQQLYHSVHSCIIAVLQSQFDAGTESHQPTLCDNPNKVPASQEPFLCFQRRSRGDILIRNREVDPSAKAPKIVGSAQRRRQGAILQHGSILLDRSPAAPELPGICQQTGQAFLPGQLLESLPSRLAAELGLELVESELSEQLIALAEQLELTKYSQPNWTERR